VVTDCVRDLRRATFYVVTLIFALSKALVLSTIRLDTYEHVRVWYDSATRYFIAVGWCDPRTESRKNLIAAAAVLLYKARFPAYARNARSQTRLAREMERSNLT